MQRRSNRESFILLLGDVVAFFGALLLTLLARNGEWPTSELWSLHVWPFSILFALWVVVFFIFDLYGRQRSAFRRRIFSIVLRAQVVNSLLAALIFYFLPIGIAPKTSLLLNLFFSLGLILLWRLYGTDFVYSTGGVEAVLFGEGPEIEELRTELQANMKYGIDLLPEAHINGRVEAVIVDLRDPDTMRRHREFYDLIRYGVRFLDVRYLYEQIFDRVPLSLIEEGWFLENVSGRTKFSYDVLKRIMDLVISIPLWILSLLVYPFVILAIKLEDGGSVFVTQERVGKNGKLFKMHKFRSMTGSDGGKEVLRSERMVTRVGKFLRKTRVDELPQLLSVIKGDQSLVGPRPELPALADVYRKEIPYYDMRHIIKPGLSGWAQIYHERHPHHGTDVEETKAKLAYDLFYIKNRSFTLDLKIALKTLKILLSFVGA